MIQQTYSLFCTTALTNYCFLFFFFFNDTATTEIYTLSLHDALPISIRRDLLILRLPLPLVALEHYELGRVGAEERSEEHTSELQSQSNLVCRLLLEKKKKKNHDYTSNNQY